MHPLVSIAKRTIEENVRTGRAMAVPDAIEEFRGLRAGVFVSLKKRGMLRGCIGTIEPQCGSVEEEVMQNAISAAFGDPRFPPVRPDELDALEYSVDVLYPPEPVDNPGMLDPERYGVIVSKGRRRGLLLPALDGVNTVEEQLDIAMRKAGIGPEEEDVRIERFEVRRFR